jgi:mycothiol synthase
MLGKTARGALVKIRVDMISDRPHAMHCHQLQGTDGVYESSRGGPGDRDRIWLRALSREIRWHDLESLTAIDALAQKYLPEMWRNPPPAAHRSGHGGGDYFQVLDFLGAIAGEAPCPLGIHEAMDLTLPGLVSQQSVLQRGAWLDVPDSRTWTGEPRPMQLQMVWPRDRLDRPPAVRLPEGYRLRQISPADEAAYIALLAKAGFEGWNHDRVARTQDFSLPGGFFAAEHVASGELVATTVALHGPCEQHPHGGELGWVAGDPAYKGKGLGEAVVSAATARFLQAGYEDVYLRTDDFRLPAIRVYLKVGYRPLLFAPDMPPRWEAIRKALGPKWPGGFGE